MHKTRLVARHEFSITLGRLSYRIFAASVPVLAVIGFIAVAIIQAVISDDATEEAAPPHVVTVGYVDLTTGDDGQPLFGGFQRQGSTTFAPYPDQETATRALLEGGIDHLFVFPASYMETGTVMEVREETSGLLEDGGQSAALRRFIVENLFAGQVGTEQIERIVSLYSLDTLEVSESGAPTDDDGFGGSLFFIAVGFLLIVSALTASGYMLQGLSEEKENRVMEVLLSSIKPEHLMYGKLIGLGAAGLLQMVIWAGAGVMFVLSLGLLIDFPPGLALAPSPGDLLIALAYFVLGYALLGTLQAAIGAVTTSQREAGNITAFVILPFVSPLWFLFTLLQEPESTFARVLSFIPFTAPITSLTRLSLGGMGIADVILSLAILSLSVALAAWLTVRLFRAYLLSYGQRPRMGDLLRTLRGG